MRQRRQKDKTDAYKLDFALTENSTVKTWAAFEHRYDVEAQRQYWQAHKAEILPGWIDKHPGTRPFAWWAFEAPEHRQKLSHAGPDNEALAEMGGGSHYGIPDHYSDPHEIRQDKPVFESQAAFLKRHGLMSQTEQRRVKQYQYEPETI